MCRLYGFRSTHPTRVECSLVHSQNALMVQSRTDATTGRSHGHGWGIAVYEDGFPLVSREAWDAYQNEAFRDAAARVYSKAVIAHVRRATVGATRIENTHPFVHEAWAFAHNGTIPHFRSIRSQMLEQISDEHRGEILGETDSEVFFRLFLTRLDEVDGNAELALETSVEQVVEWCRQEDRSARIGLNVLVTDGRQLVGTRWGRTLLYVTRRGVTDCEICRYPHVRTDTPHDYRSLVVASEPLTHGEIWEEVPEGSIFAASEGCSLNIRSLKPEAEYSTPVRTSSRAEPLRTTLVDEFMIDHRALAEGIERLIELLKADRVADARFEAARIDRLSGAHIAFEESDLYPAIGAEPSMYDEHRAGRAMLRAVIDAERPGDVERCDLVNEAEDMLDHMEDCGVLLHRVRTLTPLAQSQLEDRLFEWRRAAPKWMELDVAHEV